MFQSWFLYKISGIQIQSIIRFGTAKSINTYYRPKQPTTQHGFVKDRFISRKAEDVER